jgi:hypothetical protein
MTITVFSVVLVQFIFGFPIVSAPSEVEYGYCNEHPHGEFGIVPGAVTGEVALGVHFSADKVVMISTNETLVKRIRVFTNTNTKIWRILDWNETSSQPGSTIIANGTITPPSIGWFSFEISPVMVPNEFFIGFYNATSSSGVKISYDNSVYSGRTRVISDGPPVELLNNLLIRVVVDVPETIEDLQTKLDVLEANFTSQCDNVTKTVTEINTKIGEPTSSVFSKLDEILDKLDEILSKMCPPIGGYILLPAELNQNLTAVIIGLLSILLIVLIKNRT